MFGIDRKTATPTDGTVSKDDPQITRIYEALDSHNVSRDIVALDNIVSALNCNYCNGSVDKAIELLLFFNDAITGKVVPISDFDARSIGMVYHRLMGADNRNGVTCYLDTLMFSMFARLESFEPMLFKSFDYDTSPEKSNLAIFLRLYVNMMRSGKLITTDITKMLLTAIKKAGWNSSCFVKQQDCFDLFGFIADMLNMPMITLRLDIAHGGKEDKQDDHKLINERMLLISVPGDEADPPILLEQCLENYFSNSISVSRQLERRRTLGSVDSPFGRGRKFSVCIQSTEVTGSSTSINLPETPSQILVDESFVDDKDESEIIASPSSPNSTSVLGEKHVHTLWTRNMEINLPAWMFLQLVPFYTNETSTKNALPIPLATSQFANTRPVVGICLKRAEWSAESHSTLNTREVVVPQFIQFPSFVADDEEHYESSRSVLVLESAIFHRGKSANSGHFIALAKENSEIGYYDGKKADDSSSTKENGIQTRWLLFDDLLPAGEKVKPVDYDEVFHKEKPYILFYRLVTVEDFENESERHKISGSAPSTPPLGPTTGNVGVQAPRASTESVVSSLSSSLNPATGSTISFLETPKINVSSSSFSSTTSLKSAFQFSRRKTKSRPSSIHEVMSRSPSPLRHSLDDSRNTLASERHPLPSVVGHVHGHGHVQEDFSKFKRSKSVKHNQKPSKHLSTHDDYRNEKCIIQ